MMTHLIDVLPRREGERGATFTSQTVFSEEKNFTMQSKRAWVLKKKKVTNLFVFSGFLNGISFLSKKIYHKNYAEPLFKKIS